MNQTEHSRNNLPRPRLSAAVRWVRKAVILMIGIPLLIMGILMLVLPGPGILTIFIALLMMASEFVWARKKLVYVQERFGIDQQTIRSPAFWKSVIFFWRKTPNHGKTNNGPSANESQGQ